MRRMIGVVGMLLAFSAGVAVGQVSGVTRSEAVRLEPGKMARVGTVDARFQSYNIEMVEVTGGRFWKPYASQAVAEPTPGGNQPVGMDPNLYEYRAPINLGNGRLRKLAAALGPAYVRVSGTWANTTYFAPEAEVAPEKAPEGFNAVLTGKEWGGVLDFAQAANAELVTSFAISAGTRDAAGVWTPAEAEKVVAFTTAAGGRIAAAEFMNEPTFAMMGGAPKGYDAAAFAKDFAVFRGFARKAAPEMVLLGPGGVGEGSLLAPGNMPLVGTAEILKDTGPVFDVFSYHSYAGVSSRCGAAGAGATTTRDAALSEDWLGRGDAIEQYYAALRDQFEPGKPMWNTETAQTACGGDRWASTFVDSFRYLNQLGDLARRGVQVHMHNTLAASDYGLLDEHTYAPRPNYWAALLWHRLMGTTVLDAGGANGRGLHVYAHCLAGHPGGVAVLAISSSRDKAQTIEIPAGGGRYTLTAPELAGTRVMLNGRELELGENDSLPLLGSEAVKAGRVSLAPASITFLVFPQAENAGCR